MSFHQSIEERRSYTSLRNVGTCLSTIGQRSRHQPAPELHDVWLMPGGRFLFSKDDDGVIHLWDFGFTTSEEHDSHVEVKGFQPIRDGLRVILITCLTVNGSHNIELYDLDPLSSAPAFELIRKATIARPAWHDLDVFASSTQNRIAFYPNTAVTVWDIIDDSMVRWRV